MKYGADITVIGGGVNGTSIAMHLASRNLGDIALFEKNGLGSGATGRSGAMIREHYLTPELVNMASDAKRFFETWPQENGYDLNFKQTGRVLLFGEPDSEAAVKNAAMNRQQGVNIETLDTKSTAEILPDAFLGDIAVALYEPEAGYADSLKTTYAFANEARREGATIHAFTPIEKILTKSGKVSGVKTKYGIFETNLVVNVTGPWINKLLSPLGETLPITPIRVQMVHLRRPPSLEQFEKIVVDHTCGAYYRTDGTPFTLVGGEAEEDLQEIVNPDSFGLNADHDFITRYWERASKRVPDFNQASCRGGYGSLYDMTPDANPIIDRSTTISGLINVAGFSGHGFKLSPIIGELVADLIADDRKSNHDYKFFQASRFEDNSQIEATHPYGRRSHQ